MHTHTTLSLVIAALTMGSALGATPALSDLPLQDSISIDGVTWRFSQKAPVGRFVNGHYYVVGPVIVHSVSPAPTPERNGSVLNLPIDPGKSGFDSRVESNRYNASLRAYFPLALKAGDALISSISVEQTGVSESWLREGNEKNLSPVKSVSILTCLAAPVATDAFRPSYCDRGQRIFHADNLRRNLLPALPKVADMPDIAVWASHFRRPWLDVCFFGYDAATEYQAMYGREVGRSVGIATLMLMCDFTPAQKESLLVNIVQYGIDLWGIAQAGYAGWQAHGGHGTGRKWPIMFAGLLLGETAMLSPTRTLPQLKFGEDMQTMYATSWRGAKVVYAGHQGVWNGLPVSSNPNWGPYEHLPPAEWPCDATNGCLGENYRRCCTSIAWVGEALAARLMGVTTRWGHDAFFDYVDRWMTEDDSLAVAMIKQVRGLDYSADWERQGQCWDPFVQNMWNAYRKGANAAIQRPGSAPRRSGAHAQQRTNAGARFCTIAGKRVPTIHASSVMVKQGPAGGRTSKVVNTDLGTKTESGQDTRH